MAQKTQVRTPPKPAARTAPTPAPAAKQKLPAVRETAKLPANVSAALAQHAGKGISHAQEDNIVPLIYLLQANSPQCVRGHEKMIEGAEQGNIWLRNEPVEECIVNGEDGLEFIPCYFSKSWLEWMPDRGGFVARHPKRPNDAELHEEETDSGDTKRVWRRPNGNSVVETREFAGFYLAGDVLKPYVIPLSGTGHTVGRTWMTSLRDERLPDGSEAPIFANVWRLTTKLRTKGKNSWFQYVVQKERGLQTTEEVEKCAALHNAFTQGEKQAAAHEDAEPDEVATGEVGGDEDSEI